jgi:sulfatase maturation enzyme AslB (radical SAM superfamily)
MPVPALRELVIVVSSGCNQRCSYCWVRPGGACSPPWPAVRAAVDRLLASPEPDVRVSFTGGEPMLAFGLVRRTVRYVDAHRRAGQQVRWKLLTNGLLVDQVALRFFARWAFELQVSLDGDRDVQERRSPGSFDQVERLLSLVRRRHPRYLDEHVSLAATVTPATVGSLSESMSFLAATGAGTVGLGAALGPHASSSDLVAELDRQFVRVSREALRLYSRTRRLPFAPFRKSLIPPRPASPAGWRCAAPLNHSVTVDADGSLSSCLVATRTYAPAPPATLGEAVRFLRHLAEEERPADETDATDSRLDVLRASAARYSLHGRCDQCRFQSECRVCPLSAVREAGWADPLRVPDFVCAFNHALLAERDRFPPTCVDSSSSSG